MSKKDLLLKLSSHWKVTLTGIDEENGTIDDIVIECEDEGLKFFKITITSYLDKYSNCFPKP